MNTNPSRADIIETLCGLGSRFQFPEKTAFLAPDSAAHRSPADPQQALETLVHEFGAEALVAAGMAVRSAEGPLQFAPALAAADTPFVVLLGQDDGRPFALVTAEGCLGHPSPPLPAGLQDRLTASILRKSRLGYLYVAATVEDMILLRSLGFAATTAAGLAALSMPDVATLRRHFGMVSAEDLDSDEDLDTAEDVHGDEDTLQQSEAGARDAQAGHEDLEAAVDRHGGAVDRHGGAAVPAAGGGQIGKKQTAPVASSPATAGHAEADGETGVETGAEADGETGVETGVEAQADGNVADDRDTFGLEALNIVFVAWSPSRWELGMPATVAAAESYLAVLSQNFDMSLNLTTCAPRATTWRRWNSSSPTSRGSGSSRKCWRACSAPIPDRWEATCCRSRPGRSIMPTPWAACWGWWPTTSPGRLRPPANSTNFGRPRSNSWNGM